MNTSNFTYVVEHVDTDASKVMHFSRFASLMETTVLSSLRDINIGMETFNDARCDLLIANLKIRYHYPAHYGDQLLFEYQIRHKGFASMRFEVVVKTKENNLAVGVLDFACVDIETHKPKQIPEHINKKLEVE